MRPDTSSLNVTTSGDTFKFAKLGGGNYATWAIHMENALSSKYLWLVVDRTEAQPVQPAPKDPVAPTEAECMSSCKYQDWMAKDKAACGIICNGCKTSQWPHILNCKMSKEIWDMLRKFHHNNQLGINIHYYFGKLFTHRYVNGSLMADHIASIQDLEHKIMAASETVSDLYVAHALVLLLPKTLAWEVIKIRLLGTTPLTADSVSAALQAEANRHAQDRARGPTALFLSDKGRKGQKWKGNCTKEKPHQLLPKPTDKCCYCKHLGHWASNCPQCKKDKQKTKDMWSAVSRSVNAITEQAKELTLCEIGHIYMATTPQHSEGVILLQLLRLATPVYSE